MSRVGILIAAGFVGLGLAPSATAAAAPPALSVNAAVSGYIAAWNEPDPQRRRARVEEVWAADGGYQDPHRHAVGPEAIADMIGRAQKEFPGYRLRLISGVDAQDGYVRFSWAAGGAEATPLYLGGTDIAQFGPDGRFRQVVGFVDAAPAPRTNPR